MHVHTHEGPLHSPALTVRLGFDPETPHLEVKAELSVWTVDKPAPQSNVLSIPRDVQVPTTSQQTPRAPYPARNEFLP